jgi:tRNA uridine 5-carbamoylmethylation protein Kti12
MSKIILLRGKAGVGKTFISNELGKRLNIPIIRKDDIFDTVFNYISDNVLINNMCYEMIFKIVQTNLRINADIIIDCPFHFNNQLLDLKKRIENDKGVFKPILCICSNETVWAERFNLRKANPSPNNIITEFKEMKQHYINKGIESIPIEGELILDSINDIDELMKQTITYLENL